MASTKSSTIKVKVPTNASWFSAACASAAKRSSIMRWRRAWASNATSPKNQQSCKGMETLKYMLGPNLPLFLMFFYGEGWENHGKSTCFLCYIFFGGVSIHDPKVLLQGSSPRTFELRFGISPLKTRTPAAMETNTGGSTQAWQWLSIISLQQECDSVSWPASVMLYNHDSFILPMSFKDLSSASIQLCSSAKSTVCFSASPAACRLAVAATYLFP